jgi:hypothetical protein
LLPTGGTVVDARAKRGAIARMAFYAQRKPAVQQVVSTTDLLPARQQHGGQRSATARAHARRPTEGAGGRLLKAHAKTETGAPPDVNKAVPPTSETELPLPRS